MDAERTRPGSSPARVAILPVFGLALVVLAITIAAYAGVPRHEFVSWDDLDYVVENSLVLHHDYGTLLRAVISNNYHPLTMLSLAVNAGSPLSPKPFLVTNLALHAINTGLVFWLIFLLSKRRLFPAFWGALFFGIHPMHVESVAWISERKDVLYSAFFLGAAITYWQYLTTRKRLWLGITLALFVLSCLAKGMAVVFPVIMVLMDLWYRRRSPLGTSSLLEKAPFFAVALLFGLVAVNVQGIGDFHGLLIRTDYHLKGLADQLPLTPIERVVLPAYGFMSYLWRLFLPLGLSAFYPYPSAAEAGNIRYLAGPICLLAAAALAVWDVRRTRIITFGLGWFVVTIAPVLQWIPVGEAMVADRYAYLSYVGPLFALAMGISELTRGKRSLLVASSIALGAVALVFSVWTARQAETWKNSDALWSNVIRRYPRSHLGYLARGNARGGAGRIDEAFQDLQTARRLGSKKGDLYNGLGNAFGSRGDLDSAIVMYNTGLALEPNMGRTYFNRAIAYLRLSRPSEALADLQQARALSPVLTLNFHIPTANAYLQLKRFREAVAECDSAIAEGQRDPNIYYSRALGKYSLGDSTGAAEDLREARRLSGARRQP